MGSPPHSWALRVTNKSRLGSRARKPCWRAWREGAQEQTLHSHRTRVTGRGTPCHSAVQETHFLRTETHRSARPAPSRAVRLSTRPPLRP